MELEALGQHSRQLVAKVADFIQNELGKVSSEQIEEKELNSLVSYVDRTAEEQLVEGFSKLLPGSAFLTEEETVQQEEAEYRWIIDPLDGTTNFLHQLPCFAVSVALQQNDKTILGIVHEVTRKEQFYSWEGSGAFLNGKAIQVSKTALLKDSLIATGFPYRDYRHMEQYLEVFCYFMKNTRGIRRFGAAAVDLAWVACGRFDAFFEYGLSPWDLAAGTYLIEQAGGHVFDFKGGDDYLFGEELIATNALCTGEFLGAIRKAFAK